MLSILVLSLALFAQQATPPSRPPTPSPSAKPPCRNPDATGAYKVGCGVTAPIVIHSGEPTYHASEKGVVCSGLLFSLTVDTNGNPTNVRILNSKIETVDKDVRAAQQQFEASLTEVVRQYRFKPATFEAKPVAVQMNIEINIDPF